MRPHPECQDLGIWVKQMKKNQKTLDIAERIIREGVSNQIAFNIMDIKDLKQFWDKLRSICTEVGQGVVYSLLQVLFYYPSIMKPK